MTHLQLWNLMVNTTLLELVVVDLYQKTAGLGMLAVKGQVVVLHQMP